MAKGDGDGIKIIVAAFFFGGYFLIDGYRRFRLRRLVQDMPTSPIQSAPQGFVELQGVAYPLAKQVFKGVMGTPIIFAEIEAQRYVRSNKSSRWETMLEGTVGTRFILSDKTGHSHVLTKNAELRLYESTYVWNDLTADVQTQFMTDVLPHLKTKGWSLFSETVGSGTWRILERSLYPGEAVFALGSFRSRSNEPEVDIEDIKGLVSRVKPVGGLMKTSIHPLVIADCHQNELLQRLGNWSVARMVLGAVLLAAGAWFSLLYFKIEMP